MTREFEDKYRKMFKTGNRMRTTWVALKPLSSSAVNMLVSKTLRRGPDSCISLSQYIYKSSSGNAFSARRMLTDLQRQHLVNFLFFFLVVFDRFSCTCSSDCVWFQQEPLAVRLCHTYCDIYAWRTSCRYEVPDTEPDNIDCDVTGFGEDLSFYVSLFRELPEDTKDCLIICALLGSP